MASGGSAHALAELLEGAGLHSLARRLRGGMDGVKDDVNTAKSIAARSAKVGRERRATTIDPLEDEEDELWQLTKLYNPQYSHYDLQKNVRKGPAGEDWDFDQRKLDEAASTAVKMAEHHQRELDSAEEAMRKEPLKKQIADLKKRGIEAPEVKWANNIRQRIAALKAQAEDFRQQLADYKGSGKRSHKAQYIRWMLGKVKGNRTEDFYRRPYPRDPTRTPEVAGWSSSEWKGKYKPFAPERMNSRSKFIEALLPTQLPYKARAKKAVAAPAPPAPAPPAPAAAPIPLIKTLPQSMRKDMYEKLSGMEETHRYKVGLAHPIDYITKWVTKFMNQKGYWGKGYDTAADFLRRVLEYINANAKDATWDGKEQKVILLSDWEKIFL